jgi:hypothetical protein
MTSDNTALIAELEAAEKGSRELSDRVLLALGWVTFREYGFIWWGKNKRSSGPEDDRPSPSESLDDVLAMVPEGWQWTGSNRAPKPHAGRAYIHNRELHFTGLGAAPNPAYRGFEATAATPALALCIVILQAKEADNDQR